MCESNQKKLTKELFNVVSPITLRIPSLVQCKDDILILAEYVFEPVLHQRVSAVTDAKLSGKG